MGGSLACGHEGLVAGLPWLVWALVTDGKMEKMGAIQQNGEVIRAWLVDVGYVSVRL